MDYDGKVIYSHDKKIWTTYPSAQARMLWFDILGTVYDDPTFTIHIVDVNTIDRYLEVSVIQRCGNPDVHLPTPLVSFTSGIGRAY
jgi:hypothetical protein